MPYGKSSEVRLSVLNPLIMDCAPNVNIFRELQVVHDTGFLPLSSRSHISPEEDWQQVYLTEFAVQVLLRKLEPNLLLLL